MRRNSAFTLVESLVVIAIAMPNCHDTFNILPSGVILATGDSHYPAVGCGSQTDPIESWGWGALILPFMELSAIHESMAVARSP